MLDEKNEEAKVPEESKGGYTSTSTGIGTSCDIGTNDQSSSDSHYGYFNPNSQEVAEFKTHIEKVRNGRKAGYTSFEHLSLNLDLKQLWTFELIKSLTEDILFPVFIKEIDIKYLEMDNEYVKDFLGKLETEIDELLINVYCLPKYEGDEKLDFSEYEDCLQHAISRVRRNAFLHNFEFTSAQFSAIIRQVSSTYEGNNLTGKLSFNSSNITIDDGQIDFGDGKYNLETLYFNGSKIKCEDGPEEGMRRIIEAIANSPLQVSLKKIEVYECNVRKQDVARLLKLYQIEHVKV